MEPLSSIVDPPAYLTPRSVPKHPISPGTGNKRSSNTWGTSYLGRRSSSLCRSSRTPARASRLRAVRAEALAQPNRRRDVDPVSRTSSCDRVSRAPDATRSGAHQDTSGLARRHGPAPGSGVATIGPRSRMTTIEELPWLLSYRHARTPATGPGCPDRTTDCRSGAAREDSLRFTLVAAVR